MMQVGHNPMGQGGPPPGALSSPLPPPPGAIPVPPPPGAMPATGAPHPHAPPQASSNVGQPGSAEGGPTQVSSLPLPPLQYIKCYTDENVSRGVAPPPPPPILNEPYTMFGAPFPPASSLSSAENDSNIIQSLESQGFRRLYSAKDIDRKKELKKLNHSLLVNFLDLLDILIKCPDTSRREEKLEDVNLLFIHMHHLINEFRPHQARETLRVMLHVQKRKRLQVAEKFQEHLDKIQDTIQEALESLPEPEEDCKLNVIVPKVEAENADSNSTKENEERDPCSSLDRLMCQIVDGFSGD